jgi:hypothetical protein
MSIGMTVRLVPHLSTGLQAVRAMGIPLWLITGGAQLARRKDASDAVKRARATEAAAFDRARRTS